jgi:hypothetical protein
VPEQPVDDVDDVAVMHVVHREHERGPPGNTKHAWLSIEAVKRYIGGQASRDLFGKSVGICRMPDSEEVVGSCRQSLQDTPRCGANADLDEAGSGAPIRNRRAGGDRARMREKQRSFPIAPPNALALGRATESP